MLVNDSILEKTKICFLKLLNKNIRISIAESCTGGLLSFLFTCFSNASRVFDCSFITYSNSSKVELLSVAKKLIDTYGAVSSEVAIAMSEGALQKSSANLAIAITGIAGPQGFSEEKPLGLVYIAFSEKMRTVCKKYVFKNQTRFHVQLKAVEEALNMIIEALDEKFD